MSVLLVLIYTMKNRGQMVASHSHKFYSQSALGVALLYSASSFKGIATIKICRNVQPYRLYYKTINHMVTTNDIHYYHQTTIAS